MKQQFESDSFNVEVAGMKRTEQADDCKAKRTRKGICDLYQPDPPNEKAIH